MFKLCITGDLGFEFWKDIPGYEGYYKISTYGNIFGIKRGKPLSQFSDKRGYMRVNLCKNGKRQYQLTVHRLIAKTFLPYPPKKLKTWRVEVNHKDENKLNNRIENLEWCEGEYNNEYGTHRERSKLKMQKPIAQYKLDGTLVKIYPSIKKAENELGYPHTNHISPKKEEYKIAHGFIWKYA